jgi:hypothetical protein
LAGGGGGPLVLDDEEEVEVVDELLEVSAPPPPPPPQPDTNGTTDNATPERAIKNDRLSIFMPEIFSLSTLISLHDDLHASKNGIKSSIVFANN